jgi:hypothetical protein
MTEREKIEFLAGEVHALMGFATAVVLSHSDLSLLASKIEEVSQANLARAEGESVTDSYVDGVLEIWDRLRGALQIAEAARSRPKSPG